MRIALIGSGGREHALAVKIAECDSCNKLFIIPGNPGTRQVGENIPIDKDDHERIISFCLEQKIDLVVIGPEKPLIEGLTDKLLEKGIKIFGPTMKASRIEGEKSFAKNLMKEYNIPTAAFEVFNKENYDDAINYLHKVNYPIVIKADGIASGKGVIIAGSYDDAKEALKECFVNSSFGTAGDKVVIEEFMLGQEASIFAITDGFDFILLPAAQDHKRIFDGDKGKNTGGMGAYAPIPFLNKKNLKLVAKEIIEPTLKAMREKKSPFIGCLYCGLMMTTQGPKVVEFNCRFGDPETQVILPLLEGNFVELLYSTACGKINKEAVGYNDGASVCVVVASKGYPDKFENGFEIYGLENFPQNIKVYHAGTKEVDGKILTNGGRVLDVTSFTEKNDLNKAKKIAYETLSKISFDGMCFRKDISDKAFLQTN
ncbi:MAG: phosphoribosylamine--glycine ligase [Ignavibacteriales bacterium]|nr:MAG: phosphoribosylamine--glycine ligase [Ignavibacteriales bacterium]